jgi:RNA polymerase sigma factor (sigma-70 family)
MVTMGEVKGSGKGTLMSSGSRSGLLRQFRTLFEAGTVAGLTDGQLLERFLAGRDDGGEIAFEALVARHGPMVLGVCRRALADPNDAADAFQATFLVLVRKARSIRVDDSLGRWLYGVSRRVASRARASAARRPQAVDGEFDYVEAPRHDPDRFELASLLDEELARLPESFRSALVLCDLEGLTHEEAARDLRCPVGTIKSRLSRGRERLRGRLARRGLSPTSMMVAPVVPALMAESTVRASLISTGSIKSAVGVVSASAVALAEGVLTSMTGIKLKLAASAFLAIGVAASGAGLLGQPQEGKPISKRAEKAEVAHQPGDRASEAEPPGRHVVEMSDGKLTLDGQDASKEQLLNRLKSLFDKKDQPIPSVLMRVKSDTSYSDFIRVVDIVKAAGIAEIKFEGALAPIEPKPEAPASPKAADKTQRSLEELLGELDRARMTLKVAERIARDPQDPSILLARRRISELETALAQINNYVASLPLAQINKEMAVLRGDVPDPKKPDQPANQGRKRWPGRGQGVEPPREFQKVSMPDYVVEPPDIIIVEVLEALPGRPITGERLVRPDGKISLGFYGEVYVAGLTTTEIKAKVATQLQEFINDETLGLTRYNSETEKIEPVEPSRTNRIFVDVTSFNSKAYYVQGEVATPGRLPITGNETVLDAINFAGGLLPSAAKDRIRLVRPAQDATRSEQTLLVDLPAIISQGQTKTNYQLLPGDRLIVDRDPKIAIEDAKVAKPEKSAPSDVEVRLQTVERKLDDVLKALERLSKP